MSIALRFLRSSDTAYILFYLGSSPRLFENHGLTTGCLSKKVQGKVEKCLADFNASQIDEGAFATRIATINAEYCRDNNLDQSHYLGSDTMPGLAVLIDRLKVHARERSINNILHDHDENFFDGADRLTSLSASVSDAINASSAIKTDIQSSEEIQKQYTALLEEGFGKPLSTGIGTLDALLGGGFYPGYHIIAARTSIGKTVMLTDVARRAAQRGDHVLFFTFEMQAYRLMSRYVSYLTGLSQLQLKSFSALSHADQNAVSQAVGQIIKWNISMVDKPCTPQMIKGYVNQYIAEKGKPAGIFVDYIQRIKGKGGDFDRINQASAALQEIYKEYDVPVIAAAQINRAYTKNSSEDFNEDLDPPQREDLKSSGAMEEDADTVITMTRDRNAPETFMNGAVRKSRDGEVGLWQGFFVGVRQSLYSDQQSYWNEIQVR